MTPVVAPSTAPAPGPTVAFQVLRSPNPDRPTEWKKPVYFGDVLTEGFFKGQIGDAISAASTLAQHNNGQAVGVFSTPGNQGFAFMSLLNAKAAPLQFELPEGGPAGGPFTDRFERGDLLHNGPFLQAIVGATSAASFNNTNVAEVEGLVSVPPSETPVQ
jgi:hypothetical protein